MTWAIDVGRDEVCEVLAAAGQFTPLETRGAGIWVHHDGERRQWSGVAEEFRWHVVGALCDPFDTQLLPARVIGEAHYLTADAGSCTIRIPDHDRVAIIDVPTASSVIDMFDHEPPLPRRDSCDAVASATLTVGDLRMLLERSRHVPYGPSNDTYPPPRLVVLDGEIAIHTDWSVRGGRRTTYRVDADTLGSGTAGITMNAICEILATCEPSDDVTISVPATLPGLVELRWGNYTLFHDSEAIDATRHHDRLEVTLEEMGVDELTSPEYGSFVFWVEGHEFTAQLLDAPDEIVRVATLVCGSLMLSNDLLTQVNESNSGFVGGRLWIDGDRIWAAIELPVPAMASVPWAIDSLTTQLRGFDVFLGAFGGVASEG